MTTPKDGVDPKTTTFATSCTALLGDQIIISTLAIGEITGFKYFGNQGREYRLQGVDRNCPGNGRYRLSNRHPWSPDGKFMYVADMINGRFGFDSQTRKKLGSIGRPGRYAGQFHWLHSLDADQDGNLYATEVHTGQRVQKLVFLGVE